MGGVSDKPTRTERAVRSTWRLRFSLRTLLLFTFSAGAGMLLVHNWRPWASDFAIEENGAIAAFPMVDQDDILHLIVMERSPGHADLHVHVMRAICDGHLISKDVADSERVLDGVARKAGLKEMSVALSSSNNGDLLRRTCASLKLPHLVSTGFPLIAAFHGKESYCLLPDVETVIHFTNQPGVHFLDRSYVVWKARGALKWYGFFRLPEAWALMTIIALLFASLYWDLFK